MSSSIPPKPAASYETIVRERLITEAREEGDTNTLDMTIASAIMGWPRDPVRRSEEDLRRLWFGFFLAGQSYDAENPKQDAILRHLLYIREAGKDAAAEATQGLITENATATATISNLSPLADWKDLPFLAEDFYTLWFEQRASMTVTERLNLSSFIAKLAGTGVRGNDFAAFALMDLRDALEQGSGEQVALPDLLPLVHRWLEHARDKLWHLCKISFEPLPQHDGTPHLKDSIAPGDRARNAGVTRPGFSRERWQFWKSSLKDMVIQHDAAREAGKQPFQSGVERSALLMMEYADGVRIIKARTVRDS